MTETTNNQETQQVIDELRPEATTPEDHAVLESWQQEAEAERKSAVDGLGTKTVKLAQLPDGSIVTAGELEAARAAGHEITGPYGGSGRR